MSGKEKPALLVSACLCGKPVRYDGRALEDPRFSRLEAEGLTLCVCPEGLGGLPTPRCPAEIRGERVVTRDGRDVTGAYRLGARRTLELCLAAGIRRAVLKENSPSCGSSCVYDGSFTGVKRPGEGVTARLLRENGIEVYSEETCPEDIWKDG